MGLPGWGTLVGRIAQWIPSKKESTLNQIDKLKDENATLAQEVPLSTKSAERIAINVGRIAGLRKSLERLD